MRVGHNPARFVEKVAQPAEITVAVVNCIPFLSGYYEQSLEVLKVVVESLHATREPAHPYDVMVFDNHSCAEVREYLKEASDQGKIQYLVLSDTNIGKIGAWNFMFGAAAGQVYRLLRWRCGFPPRLALGFPEALRDFPKCWHGDRPSAAHADGVFHLPRWIGRSRPGCWKKAVSWTGKLSGSMSKAWGGMKQNRARTMQKASEYRLTYGGQDGFCRRGAFPVHGAA